MSARRAHATAAAASPRDGHGYDAALARRVLRYLRPYRVPLSMSLGLLFVSGALALAGPYLTKVAIDDAIPAGDHGLLGRLVLAYLGVLGLGFLTGYAQHLLMIRTGQSVMYDLRRELFAHFQRLGLSWFDRNPVGRLVTRVTSDVETLNELLTSGIVTILGDLVTLVGITVILFWMDPKLALLTFAVVPFLLVASVVFRRRARDGFRETRERVARLNTLLQEHFTGIEVVKLFGREAENDRAFDRENAACRDAWIATVDAFAIFFPLVQFLLATALAVILWGGGQEVLRGVVTFGELVAFLQYAQRFFAPLRDLSEKYNVLQAAMAACERIFGVLDAPADDPDRASRTAPERIEGRIEFRDVSFRYRPDEPVLDRVSFTVEPGERVALVGATGAGKSTVLWLLLGLYRPTSGSIRIDGHDLASLDPRAVRRRIGTVLQDVFLFSADVDWNVRLGDEDLPAARVRSALETARADRFVDRLPGGMKERLGDRGRGLSSGERQLLSFARALAPDPDVLLLDEATSSVDSETEGLVQEALPALVAGRTCLIVAHRLSTVRDCDRILVFHRGRLCEQGTHDQLLARSGIYARLVELQFGAQVV